MYSACLSLLLLSSSGIGGSAEQVYPISAKVAPQVYPISAKVAPQIYTVKNHSIQKYSAEIAVGIITKSINSVEFPAKLNQQSLTDTIKSVNNISLSIDGHKEHGPRGLLKALHRISLYTFNRKKDGSVYYEYNMQYENLHLERSTCISYKEIKFNTNITGFKKSLMLKYASILITINEVKSDLVFSISSYGSIGYFKCCIVNAIARRVAPKQIRSGLLNAINAAYIKVKGIRESGSIDSMIQLFADRIKNGIRVNNMTGTRRRY